MNFKYNTSVFKNHSYTLQFLAKLKPLDWFFGIFSFAVIVFLIISSINQEKWIAIEFKVTNSASYFSENDLGDTPYWLIDKVAAGDVQYDKFGKVNLKVLQIKQWGFQKKEVWISAVVKAKYLSKGKTYTYLYQPLQIGRGIDISLNGSTIHGIINAIEGYSDTRQTKKLKVKARIVDPIAPYSAYTRGIEPWIADAIHKDEIIKDFSGKTLATILDVIVTPAERVVTTADGRAVLSSDPIKKDVYLTLEISVTKQGSTYLFLEDKPIIIGKPIPLFFNNLALFPTITEVLE